jgi:hypothetical protein
MPRKALVSLDDTAYYHYMSRCARRIFLCGTDPFTQQSYEYRRQWIQDILKELTSYFSNDCCDYALMSNRYHLVLFVDRDRAKDWTLDEVIERWQKLCKGSVLVDRYRSGQNPSRAERDALSQLVSKWRERLSVINWFMRCLNESVARRANQDESTHNTTHI